MSSARFLEFLVAGRSGLTLGARGASAEGLRPGRSSLRGFSLVRLELLCTGEACFNEFKPMAAVLSSEVFPLLEVATRAFNTGVPNPKFVVGNNTDETDDPAETDLE